MRLSRAVLFFASTLVVACSSTPRCCQRSGKSACTWGCAKASTVSGRAESDRSAASMARALGRSPQCRSSSTRTTGRAMVSASSQSSQHETTRSAIVPGSRRAARTSGPASGNGSAHLFFRRAVRAVAGRTDKSVCATEAGDLRSLGRRGGDHRVAVPGAVRRGAS